MDCVLCSAAVTGSSTLQKCKLSPLRTFHPLRVEVSFHPPGSAAPAGELKRMKSGLHPEGQGQPDEGPGAGVSAITSPDLCIGYFLTDG